MAVIVLTPPLTLVMGAIPYGGAGCQIWNYAGTGWGITGQVSPDLAETSKGKREMGYSIEHYWAK